MQTLAYLHYDREDGLPTHAVGMLTDEHPASSYGQPVWVAHSNMRLDDPIQPGAAYGPADLPFYEDLVATPSRDNSGDSQEDLALVESARAAGYRVTYPGVEDRLVL